MKKFVTTFLLFLSVSAIPFNAMCQKAPIKYGDIDIADLEMTVYDKDSSAEAVVLCDYGYFTPQDFTFTRIYRVKILKKTGYRWVNRRIYSPTKNTIKGQTYNLENGEIKINKLNLENVYKERITKDFYRMNVTMPNVKEGSIVDIKYTLPGLPYEWYFQDQIPVKWSELRIPSSHFIEFQKNFTGYESLFTNSSYQWVGKDMPALKEEPYMNSISNYLTKFEIEISNVNFPGYFQLYLTTSWGAVNTFLLDHQFFGEKIKTSNFLKEAVDSIKNKTLTKEEELIEAFELIKHKVKWNDENNLYAYSDPSYLYNKGFAGNSSEVNLTLFLLLEDLGFEVYPVALSTRDNGVLSPIYPSINKLNYVITQVKLGDNYYLLDATEELMPMGLIPERCINWKGRKISNNSSDWVNLMDNKKDKEVSFSELTLDGNGEITGKISYSRSDYAAYYFRKKYTSFNSENEFIKNIEKEKPGLFVNNYELKNIDSIYLPMKDEYIVYIENMSEQVGDKIYLNPMLYERLSENPFKLDERKFPVDYPYLIEKNYTLRLTIPENYIVAEAPSPLRLSLPEDTGSFYYDLKINGNIAQLSCKFCINKNFFLTTEYPALKEFYNQIVAKHAEQIILKKKNEL